MTYKKIIYILILLINFSIYVFDCLNYLKPTLKFDSNNCKMKTSNGFACCHYRVVLINQTSQIENGYGGCIPVQNDTNHSLTNKSNIDYFKKQFIYSNNPRVDFNITCLSYYRNSILKILLMMSFFFLV